MSSVINNLKSRFQELRVLPLDDFTFNIQRFDLKFTTLDTPFFVKIASEYPSLQLEFNVLRQQLKANLAKDDWDQRVNYNKIREQLITAYVLARLFERLNLDDYLDLKYDAANFHNYHEKYKVLLTHSEYNEVNIGSSITEQIRAATAKATWYRLMITRSRRLLDLVAVLGTGFQPYQDLVTIINPFAIQILNHIAWFFFIPRLLANFFSIQELGWRWVSSGNNDPFGWIRMKLLLQKIASDLINDVPWLIVGLINCLLLIGVLSTGAPTLTAIFFAYDLIWAGLKMSIDLGRLLDLKQKYDKDDEFQNHLKLKINYELCRLILSFIVAAAVLAGGCCALSVFAGCPFVPLAGAILLVSTSLFLFVIDKLLLSQKPAEDPETLPVFSNPTKFGFFSQKIARINTLECYEKETKSPLNAHKAICSRL